MRNNKGLILTITIIFVLILVIMAGTVLLLMTNHARVTEAQVRRVKAIDAAESGALVRAYAELGSGVLSPAPPPCPFPCPSRYIPNYLTLSDPPVEVSLCIATRGYTQDCGSEVDLVCPGTATNPPQYCVRARVRYLE